MTFDPTQGNLLIVANNFDTLQLLNKHLPIALPEVKFVFAARASTGMSFLDALIKEGMLPRLILLDLYLPNRADSIDFLRQLKQTGSSAQSIPVVMMSSTERIEDILEVTLLGAEAFWIKPITTEAWIKSLEGLRGYWQA
ncbi:response regulator [Spirosoma endbachense]|uniref:Response regulator n=1 Tax=Spirosoma endbachense TaxID=2666025 RepID=A0A6P1VXT1_9BACT|nr:response regulator [Spirosoma endbachense]QHV96597.1 response regulator [Spirosoma endbachense]